MQADVHACRYQFLEDLWARRKQKKPLSSIEFALREQQMDSTKVHQQAPVNASPGKVTGPDVPVRSNLQYRAMKQYSEVSEV